MFDFVEEESLIMMLLTGKWHKISNSNGFKIVWFKFLKYPKYDFIYKSMNSFIIYKYMLCNEVAGAMLFSPNDLRVPIDIYFNANVYLPVKELDIYEHIHS